MPSVPTFRSADSLTPASDPPREPASGDIRFRLSVPALTFDQYLAMQAVMANRHLMKTRIDPGLVWLGLVALVSAALIAASFALGITSGLSVDVKAWEWSTHIGGGPLLLIVAAIAGLAYFAATARQEAVFIAFAAALHDEGRDLFGPQEIVLTDEAIHCANATGTHTIRWNTVSDLILDQGCWYAILQGNLAVWMPEAAIRATEDPDGLRTFLNERFAATRGA